LLRNFLVHLVLAQATPVCYQDTTGMCCVEHIGKSRSRSSLLGILALERAWVLLGSTVYRVLVQVQATPVCYQDTTGMCCVEHIGKSRSRSSLLGILALERAWALLGSTVYRVLVQVQAMLE